MPVKGGTNSFGWPLFYFYLYVLDSIFVAIVSFCHCFSCYFRILLFSCHLNTCLVLGLIAFVCHLLIVLFSFVFCVISLAKATA